MISNWPTMEELGEMFKVWSRTQNAGGILKFDTFLAGINVEIREKNRNTSWVTKPLRSESRNDLAERIEAIQCKHIPIGLGWLYRLRYNHG